MTMRVQSLTSEGLAQFRLYLQALGAGSSDAPPLQLLEGSPHTSSVAPAVVVDEARVFADKLDFGTYLCRALDPLSTRPGFDTDIGIWSWLALLYFDQLCPAKRDGTRKPGATHRLVLSEDYRHHYRHLVRTPYTTYRFHGPNSRLVLAGDLSTHGEAAEQLLSREEIFRCKSLFAVLDRLYVAEADNGVKIKRGAMGKGRGGTLRRMGKILKQFNLTYDLHAMSTDDIYALLPSEFDRFKSQAS